MNTTQVKQLIEFYPSQCKYLAIYWDSQRNMPFWFTGRNDASISPQTFYAIVRAFKVERMERIERDESWLLIDMESGEASVLPWEEANEICQQQFKDNPELALTAETNALLVAKRLYSQWHKLKD
jgi:hypothetical protein